MSTNDLFSSLFNLNAGNVNNDNVLSLDGNSKFKEIFNHDKMKFILDNSDTIKAMIRPSCFEDDADPFIIARKYLDKSSKIANHLEHGIVEVKYYQTDSNKIGRYFANSSLSLQSMIRELRHTISMEYYHDIDMINAHPEIIQWLCQKLDIACTALAEYNSDRDVIINALLEKNDGCDHDKIKQVILSVIYGGCKDYKALKKTKWIVAFKKEMMNIGKVISEKFYAIYNARKEIKTENLIGSTLSYIASVVENQLLQMMLNYLKKHLDCKQYEACVLCFDGVMVRNTVPMEAMLGHIANIQNEFEAVGLPMKLKIKEMKPLALNGYSPIRTFDYTDAYYYYDFVNELVNGSWTGEFGFHNLTKCVEVNINRVIVRLSTGEYFIKKDANHMLEDVKKLTDHIVKFEKVVRGEVEYHSMPLCSLIKNKFHNLIHDYDNLVFDPSGYLSSNRDFNTWTGFKAKRLDNYDVSDIQLILDHIKTVWAAGNEEHYKYMLSWLHQIFKYPFRKTKVAMVLRSEKQQIGKGIIIEDFLIPYVFGKQISLYGTCLDFLTDRFNVELMGKVFVCADELATPSGDYHKTFDKLKSLITSSTVKIEIKGGRKFNDNNHMNFIMTTNNEFALKIDKDDQRYAIFDCCNEMQGNREYFNKIFSLFTPKNADVFYSYIYDLEDTVDVRCIPETQLKNEMKISCMSTSMRFIHRVKELIDEFGDLDEKKLDEIEVYSWKKTLIQSENLVNGCLMYTLYKQFCEEEGEKPISNTKFGREIKDVITKRRSNTGMFYDLKSINTQ